MGIIPLCFKPGQDADTLGLTGYERFSIDLPTDIKSIKPGQDIEVTTDNGKSFSCTLRFDTQVFEYLISPCYLLEKFIRLQLYIRALNMICSLLINNFIPVIAFQVELTYFEHGGILQYVLRQLIDQ